MGGVAGGAGLARLRRTLDLAWSQGERLAAGAGEHDCALAEPRHRYARDRPRVGPGPGLDVLPARQRLRERTLEQDLRQQRLGVDVDGLADERATADHQREGERDHE